MEELNRAEQKALFEVVSDFLKMDTLRRGYVGGFVRSLAIKEQTKQNPKRQKGGEKHDHA